MFSRGNWTVSLAWIAPPFAVALAIAASGCDSQPKELPRKASAAAQAEAAGQGQSPPAGTPAPSHVPTLAELAARVAAAVKKADVAEVALQQQLQKAAGADAKVLKGLYAEQKLRFFERDGNVTADGKAVVDLLAELDRHGVDRSGYRLPQFDAATKAITDAFAAERAALLTLSPHARAVQVGTAAVQWLRTGDGGEVALVRAGGDQMGDADREALATQLGALLAAAQKAREAVVTADVELTRHSVRYLVDFEMGKPAHPVFYTAPAAVRRMAETQADKLVARLGPARGHTAELLTAAWPSHPQYEALLASYDAYKKLVDAGGWQPLPKPPTKKLALGDFGPFVQALRDRLRKEGYGVGEGEAFDAELQDAIKDFQGRHQLEPDGVVSKATIAEMDTPADQRLKQVQLSLQRYRESEGRDPGEFYIYVNIAFQQLWLIDHGKVEQVHKVIVGNNDTDTDQQTLLKGKINRTKMFSQKMTRIILAPRWYPTQRVIELEIGKSLAKEPDYLEKHGYVKEVAADGTETVYQMAGKDNLLGDVKFQGPNKYNIYLHDTPFKQFFAKARRTFSHGCIRVQNPVDLAEFLLARDRDMTPGQIRAAIKEKEEKIIQLKTPIPVHIDYASAGVDGEGHTVFGADVYGYDQAFFDGQLPVEEAKEYKAASVRGL